jgi:hypothetical protein
MGMPAVPGYVGPVANLTAEPTVLFAGVSDADTKEVLRVLLRNGRSPFWERVEGDALPEALRRRRWSLVVAEVSGPDLLGDGGWRVIRARPTLAIVVSASRAEAESMLALFADSRWFSNGVAAPAGNEETGEVLTGLSPRRDQ